MARKISDLASRLKSAVVAAESAHEGEEQRQRDAEQAAVRLREAAVVARAELTEALKELAKSVPGMAAKAKKDGTVTLTRGEHTVVFNPSADPAIITLAYEGAGEGERLVFDGEEWEWNCGAMRLALYDEGLEEVLCSGLGLPRPEREEAPAPVKAAAPAKSVKQALADRRRERWEKRPPKTKIIGSNHQPWDFRPSNPGVKHGEPASAAKAAEDPKGAWDVRPTHTETEKPSRKRGVDTLPPGSTTVEYKGPLD